MNLGIIMITFGYNCPHCGIQNSGFEVKTYYQNKKYSDKSIFSILSICNTCSNCIVTDISIDGSYEVSLFRKKLESEKFFNLPEALPEYYPYHVQFYPDTQLKPDTPKHLPECVENELKTAEDLYLQVKSKPHFAKVCGNAYRTTLERSLCELAENNERAKLNKRIEKLYEEGKLTLDLKNFAMHIRTLSAEASHTYNDFTVEELEELRLFINLFLQYTFTLPSMIPKVEN